MSESEFGPSIEFFDSAGQICLKLSPSSGDGGLTIHDPIYGVAIPISWDTAEDLARAIEFYLGRLYTEP